MRNKTMADDRSALENTKSAPVSTSIDGTTFPPAAPAVQQNDTLAEHIGGSPGPVLVTHVTPHDSPVDRSGRNFPDGASGAKVTPVAVGSDTTGE
jgi:hypothetical protein